MLCRCNAESWFRMKSSPVLASVVVATRRHEGKELPGVEGKYFQQESKKTNRKTPRGHYRVTQIPDETPQPIKPATTQITSTKGKW